MSVEYCFIIMAILHCKKWKKPLENQLKHNFILGITLHTKTKCLNYQKQAMALNTIL